MHVNSYELLRPVYDLFLKGCGNYDSIICDSNKLEVILKVLTYDDNYNFINCYNTEHINKIKSTLLKLDKMNHNRKKYLKYKIKYLKYKNNSL